MEPQFTLGKCIYEEPSPNLILSSNPANTIQEVPDLVHPPRPRNPIDLLDIQYRYLLVLGARRPAGRDDVLCHWERGRDAGGLSLVPGPGGHDEVEVCWYVSAEK